MNQEQDNLISGPVSDSTRNNNDQALLLIRPNEINKSNMLHEIPIKVSFCKRLQHKTAAFLEHWSVTLFMTLITIYALFADDIRQVSTNPTGDQYFYGFHMGAFGFFTLEIILGCFSKPGYINSFFFWLDVISTVSILLDVQWITAAFLGSSSSAKSAKSTTQIARAGRASRVGTRAGRIVRIIRLIRLIRIVKLYKASDTINKKKQSKNEIKDVSFSEGEQVSSSPISPTKKRKSVLIKETRELHDEKIKELMRETNVGKKLSDLTTKRVIMIVLSIMISIPLFDPDTWASDNTAYQAGIDTIWLLKENNYSKETDIAWDHFTNYFNDNRYGLLYLELAKASDDKDETIETYGDLDQVYDFRDYETQLYAAPEEIIDGSYFLIAYIDKHRDEDLNAFLSIGRTLFVCVVLTVGSLTFSKDSQSLVLEPIEKMLKTVKKIGENPLRAVELEIEDALYWQQIFEKSKSAAAEYREKQKYETAILEKTLVKIGALLALGFGEAGSQIISKNIAEGKGTVDPMIPGKKMMAIFGFCDIRNFTDATEVLQEGVMTFVNQIAEIVHSVVDSYAGSANKNIGDAFLMVWKIPSECLKEENGKLGIDLEFNNAEVLADMSIISFVKIMSEVAKSPKLDVYKRHKELNLRLKNYSVKQGFGLHMGWAIEGAIGSNYKIDASYLSPNVNMAARLEAATKQFGVPLLISGALRNIASSKCKKYLRHIDRVTVKGSIEPIDLYTCDVNTSKLEADFSKIDTKLNDLQKKILRNTVSKANAEFLKQALEEDIEVADQFENDPDLKEITSFFTSEFRELFEAGIKNYLDGNWAEAKRIFEKTLYMLPLHKDGPSNTLLEYMKEEHYTLPHNWNHYRELHEK